MVGAATGGEDRLDLLDQTLVLLGPPALALMLVRIKSAGTHFQCLGQFLDLIVHLQLTHKLEALFRCPSETIAKAFLKLSRWRWR